MESYTLEDLSLREVKALLVGIKEISIKGIDAMFIGTLQLKLQDAINQIEDQTPTPPFPSVEVN
tara:strand:- start:1455 stop:1646 length:192 start_codon:yes stop_codon:yes gene_type:complete